MPPPAAAEVAFDQSVDAVAPPDELLLPHPAASTTLPITTAKTAPVLVLRTFFPSDLRDPSGQDARIVAREHEGKISIKQIKAV